MAQAGPTLTNPMDKPMTSDTLDRLVFHVAVFGGLIALVVLPW